MLKKICPSCESVFETDVDLCDNCNRKLMFYLIPNNTVNKIKSLFSNDPQEEFIEEELEQLLDWEYLFKAYDNFEWTDKESFFKNLREFKIAKADFEYLDNLRVDNNYLLGGYIKLSKFLNYIESLDFSDITYESFLNYLRGDNIDKNEYIQEFSAKLEYIDSIIYFKYLKYFDNRFDLDIERIRSLFNEINREILQIKQLSQDFDKYNNFFKNGTNKPDNFVLFKNSLKSLKYLDILQYFDSNLINILKNADYLINSFNELEHEENKLNSLKIQINNLYDDFDSLIDGIVDDYTKQEFLDKYLDLRVDVFSFKYLDLLDSEEINRVRDFFINFDYEWKKLAIEKENMDTETQFNEALKRFNDKWEFIKDLNQPDIGNFLNQFEKEFNRFNDRYSKFINDDFNDYNEVLEYIDELNSQVEGINFDNFNVPTLLNYLKDITVSPKSKMDRINKYKDTLAEINAIDFDNLDEFYSSHNISFNDINQVEEFFKEIDSEIKKAQSLEDSNNLNDLKEIADFKYLSILPFFNPDLEDICKDILERKKIIKRVNIEKNEISSLILECSKCRLEYKKVNEGKMSSNDFISKYSDLKDKVFSFRYLDLIPSFDSNLKDFVGVVKEVKEIFKEVQ